MSNMPRLSVTLPDETMEKLRSEAEQAGVTSAEIIRRAAACYAFFAEELRAGRRLKTTEADGSDPREVVIL